MSTLETAHGIHSGAARDFSRQGHFVGVPLPWRAVAGPACAGACIGLGAELTTTLLWAVWLPAIVLATAALMLPALYIGTALVGEAPPAQRLLTSALAALDDAGLVLLGLAPAIAFLVVTTRSSASAPVALLVVAVAILLGLRSLFSNLFCVGRKAREVKPGIVLAFGLWSIVASGIGFHWFVERAAATLGGTP